MATSTKTRELPGEKPDEFDNITDEEYHIFRRRHELMNTVHVDVDVELPDEVWEVAQEHANFSEWITGTTGSEIIAEELFDYLSLSFRFTVDGEEVVQDGGYGEYEGMTRPKLTDEKGGTVVETEVDVEPEAWESAVNYAERIRKHGHREELGGGHETAPEVYLFDLMEPEYRYFVDGEDVTEEAVSWEPESHVDG